LFQGGDHRRPRGPGASRAARRILDRIRKGNPLYRELQQRLVARITDFVRQQYGMELPNIVMEQPPRVELGEYAAPLAFELARKLRKPPRAIAQEIASQIGAIAGFEKLEPAGGGYLNARLDRAAVAHQLAQPPSSPPADQARKVLVEHTSINP